MKAIEVMQRSPVTATADMTIEDAVRRMVEHRISGLPVVDATGAVVGILSEGDLLRRVELGTEARIPVWVRWLVGQGRAAREYARSHALTVREVMTVPVISVTPDTELAEVAALMESRSIKRLPVLQDGHLVGILTRHDLVRALERLLPRVDTQPVADAQLRRRLLASLAEQSWAPRASFDVKVENGIVELLGIVTDERQRRALQVLVENTPGVREVVDHLLWVDPMSGIPLDPQPWSRTG
ncbi:MAG: CBS domain-containing protein [Steroidobacteraceae bacterium]